MTVDFGRYGTESVLVFVENRLRHLGQVLLKITCQKIIVDHTEKGQIK